MWYFELRIKFNHCCKRTVKPMLQRFVAFMVDFFTRETIFFTRGTISFADLKQKWKCFSAMAVCSYVELDIMMYTKFGDLFQKNMRNIATFSVLAYCVPSFGVCHTHAMVNIAITVFGTKYRESFCIFFMLTFKINGFKRNRIHKSAFWSSVPLNNKFRFFFLKRKFFGIKKVRECF